MQTCHLFRQYFNTHTYGTLVTSFGDVLYTIERPWLNNQANISCIPKGEYLVTFLKKSASGKYRDVWHIQDVEDRSGILIHNGNLVKHTRGCLILGSKKGSLGNNPAVLRSRDAMRKLKLDMGTKPFLLNIW